MKIFSFYYFNIKDYCKATLAVNTAWIESLKCQYLLLCCRHFGMGRYAGYTQGHSEYSVKSLTESTKCEEQNNRVNIYSPVTMHHVKQDSCIRTSKGGDSVVPSKIGHLSVYTILIPDYQLRISIPLLKQGPIDIWQLGVTTTLIDQIILTARINSRTKCSD